MLKYKLLLVAVCTSYTIFAQGSCGVSLPAAGAMAPRTPDICIGTPKLWLYDRMYPMLDGLLRDVEGVSLQSLTALDANQVNTRVMDLLQNFVQASVSMDQAAGITNAFAMDSFNATRGSQLQQLKDSNSAAQALASENASIMQALAAAVDEQIKRIQALPAGTSCTSDAQCAQLQSNIDDFNAELKSIKTASAAVPSVTVKAPVLTGVSGEAPAKPNPLAPSSFVTAALSADPGTVASIPARERLDNFITLLNDRLTKELALNLHEAGLRKTYVPVLVELDVYVNPSKDRKNEQAGSLFDAQVRASADDKECSNDNDPTRPKPVIVYNLYPSMAAFNVASVVGQSKGFVLSGGFKGLFLGSNVGWQRQRDHVTQAMMQSVYVNGFRENESAFGWYYGAPAYTNTVRPGGYATFALLLVPGEDDGHGDIKACPIMIRGGSFWKDRRDRIQTVEELNPRLVPYSPAALALTKAEDRPWLKQVQYTPHYDTPAALATDVNTISIEFEDPINPNLMLTSSGKLLKRVRDWRGRATSPNASDMVSVTSSGSGTQQISRERGLFEADIDDANTWIAVSRTKIMIKLDSKTACEYRFPDLRFLVPGSKDWSLTDLVDYRTYQTEINIGDLNFLACHSQPISRGPDNDGCKAQPLSLWLPLFLSTPAKGHNMEVHLARPNAPDRSQIGTLVAAAGVTGGNAEAKLAARLMPIRAEVGIQNGVAGSGENVLTKQWYIYVTADGGRTKLRETAQVSLTGPGHGRFSHPIAIECSAFDPGLLCHLHPATIFFNLSKEQGNGAAEAVMNVNKYCVDYATDCAKARTETAAPVMKAHPKTDLKTDLKTESTSNNSPLREDCLAPVPSAGEAAGLIRS